MLRRRLTEDEVLAVAAALMSHGNAPVPGADAMVAITKITDEMPSPGHRPGQAAAGGWPVDDSWEVTN